MIYYVTRNNTEIHPMVFTPQHKNQMEEHLIIEMLVLLMKREYEEYGAETALENIYYQLSLTPEFSGAIQAPKPKEGEEMPSQQKMEEWAQELLYSTEAGTKLSNQVGAKLYPAETEEEKWLTEEATLSNYLESLWTAEPDFQ
jgi:hypothetical protein